MEVDFTEEAKAMIEKSGSNSGQAIVEFALMLPILCIVLLGIIEFGCIFYDKAMVTNASREGARKAITDIYLGQTPDIGAAVTTYLQSRLITFGGSSTWTTTPNIYYGTGPGLTDPGYIVVTVDYPYNFLALPGFLGLGNSVNLTAQTIMRLH